MKLLVRRKGDRDATGRLLRDTGSSPGGLMGSPTPPAHGPTRAWPKP